MDEPPWKKLKLSLERPYKDEEGQHIPVLLDITPEGEHIYEPKDDPSKTLGEKFKQIFVERGFDFFEKNTISSLKQGTSQTTQVDDGEMHLDENSAKDEEAPNRAMTTEELFKMRMEIIPQLYIALGEMSHAKDLLSLLLAGTTPSQPSPLPSLPSSALNATTVTKPPSISSVQAFNSQLVVGGKDELLRKAATIFKSAADSMERGRVRGEKYWVDALKIRRANWGLIPAPLPFGSATGKGADKTSKDFLISFGLEESPPLFRRRAIGHMASYETDSGALVFPNRQRTRLQVSLTISTNDGAQRTSYNKHVSVVDGILNESLKAAQQEVVEQEIFSVLIKEASNLPIASTRVSERLVVVEAAQGIELRFEMVDGDSTEPEHSNDEISARCDLIFWCLHALLLQVHAHLKTQRLGSIGVMRVPGLVQVTLTPPLLQPIIELLQYHVFCEKVDAEVDRMVRALSVAGIPSTLRFDPVGENGRQLLKLLDGEGIKKISGEAVLKLDNRHTLRLTLLSPSSLTAHLPQATLPISSIPQLIQLLFDEIEIYLLNRICELGNELCDRINGTWFVDLVNSRSVGRWEGCVLNFHISSNDSALCCTGFCTSSRATSLVTYTSKNPLPLLTWVRTIIEQALLEK